MVLETRQFNTKNFKEYEGISGIYAFIYHDEVIYVGQTNNLRRRLLQHHAFNSQRARYAGKDDERDKLRYEFYSLLEEQNSDVYFLVLPAKIEELNDLEGYYIEKYKPKYNYAGTIAKYVPLKRYLW